MCFALVVDHDAAHRPAPSHPIEINVAHIVERGPEEAHVQGDIA